MRAVVLAGGQEFGQCPLSRQMPRSLWPLIDRPIIEHVLSTLHAAGIGDMAISANGHTGEIANRLGRQPAPGITIHYNEDALPRGAAGCVKDCQPWLGRETFLVAHGACVMLGVDLPKLLSEHRRSGAVLTIAAAAEAPAASGADSALKPTGLYICESEILAHIRERGYQDMKEQLIPRLAEQNLKVHAAPIDGRIIPIRNEECYVNAMVDLLEDEESRERFTHHLPTRSPTLWVDPTAYVHPQARLVGPVYIGPGAQISAEAAVIGPAIVGPNCLIEHDAILHESILWPAARIEPNAIVEQTVMASHARIARGTAVRGCIVIDDRASQTPDPGENRAFVPPDLGLLSRGWRLIRSGLRSAPHEAL